MDSTHGGDPESSDPIEISGLSDIDRTDSAKTVIDQIAEAGGPRVEIRLEGVARPAGKTAFGRYLDPVEIGRGGMGAILRAVDPDLGRPVAVKVVVSGKWAGSGELARFLREARITGQLQHPNIPPVYEMSRTAKGQIYFTMKLIEGKSLAQVIREGGRDRRRMLADFVKVCDAVGYAHSKGVIHRDLKPANVMVGEFGEVLVLDWGLAKVRGQELSIANCELQIANCGGGEGLTVDGAVMGTPAYMAPEQAGGEIEKIDERTDVYGLGAILYEILTGSSPYAGLEYPEIKKRISEKRLERPASRASGAKIDRELDAIAMKALGHSRAHRFQTAAALKEDVERYLAGYGVVAIRSGPAARAVKWVKRNRAVSAVAAAAIVVVSFFVAGLVITLGEARRAQESALDAFDEATHESERADRQTKETAAARDDALARERHALARLLLARGVSALLNGQPDDAAILAASARGRLADPEALAAWHSSLHSESVAVGRVLGVHEGAIRALAVSPDGTRIVTGSEDRTVRIWSGSGGDSMVLVGHEAAVNSAAFSPDSTSVVTASYDGTARIWPVSGGEPVVLAGHEASVESAVFSPDGRFVVTASLDGTARVWPIAGGEPVVLSGHTREVWSAVFSSDGARVATASWDWTARVWPVAGGEPVVLAGHEGFVQSAVFSFDGTRVITASSVDRTARIWPVSGGEPIVLAGHGGQVSCGAFSLDGTRVVTASHDQTARIWPVSGGKPVVLRGHDGAVTSAAFSVDGTRVVTVSQDRTARVWAVSGGEAVVLSGHDRAVTAAAFTADGRVVTASEDRTVRIWPVSGGGPVVLAGHRQEVNSASFSPDGTHVVTASYDGNIRTWPISGREPVVRQDSLASSASLSPDGTRVVATDFRDKVARVCPLAGGDPALLAGHQDGVVSAAFSPDGTRVVTASYDKTARIWLLSGGEPVVLEHEDMVFSAAFSPEGTRVVTACRDRAARIWPASGGEPIVVLRHEGMVRCAAFSPDGTSVATASEDHKARVWPNSERGAIVLDGHTGAVRSVAFSPDGTRVATASDDHTARLWPMSGGEPVVLVGHDGEVRSAAFSPDGMRVVTASCDKTARIWDISHLYLEGPEPLWYTRLLTGLTLVGEDVRPEPILHHPPPVSSRLALEPFAPSDAIVSPLRERYLRQPAIAAAARHILQSPDPALAWLALYHALDGTIDRNTRRMIVLEAVEDHPSPRDPVLALATALVRNALEAYADQDERDAIESALEDARAAHPDHELVRAVRGWLERN